MQLDLLVLAEERAELHLLRGRLQDGAQGLGQAERRWLGRRWRLLVWQGQLLARLWVRVLCYLHLIEICLQLRLFLEEESLLLESVFLQLLFKAPWWFFTIKLTGILGF